MNFRNFKFFLLLFFFNSCSKEELKNPNSNIPISGVTPSTQFSSKLNSNETANDILFNQQWYLKNTGQMTYFNENVKEGIDLNISYPQKYTGKGVKVLVADGGVYFDHPNLEPNLLENSSLDFEDSSLGSTPINKQKIDNIESSHGTKVAGILAGSYTKNNGFRGVAPDSKIASANITSEKRDPNKISVIDMELKIYNHVENNKIQIINESNGMPEFTYSFSHENKDSLKITVKKFFTVKSSGNNTCNSTLANKYYDSNPSIHSEFSSSPPQHINDMKKLSPAEQTLLKMIRPHLSSMDSDKSNPYRIVVASISYEGIASDFSSLGSNIWISGIGGGQSSRILNHDSLDKKKDLGILTTTIPKTDNGNAATDFDKHLLPENKEGYYTTEPSGTSLAAPMISGVIALMLEANPNLSYWDVKYILAKTANREKLAPNPLPWCIKTLNVIGDFSSSFINLWKIGWVENKAGYFFHNFYGFGLVDTDKAIQMALDIKNGVTSSPYKGKKIQHIQNSLEIQNISNQFTPPNSSITSELVITENISIDGIKVTPYILAAKADSISIQLVSPDETASQRRGTHSTILYPGNSMIQLSKDASVIEDMFYPISNYKKNLNDNSGAYLTNAFFEEHSKGKWKIIITNHSSDKDFFLKGWKLEIYGH